MRKPINLIARWGLPSNWRANRKNSLPQVETINQESCTGELNQKPGHEGKHEPEHRTALNLQMKGTHNTEGPGQTGRNRAHLSYLHICYIHAGLRQKLIVIVWWFTGIQVDSKSIILLSLCNNPTTIELKYHSCKL